MLSATAENIRKITRSIALHPQHRLDAPLIPSAMPGGGCLCRGDLFQHPRQQEKLKPVPVGMMISWRVGVTATYGPSSQSRQSRQELGGIYEAILSSPSKGKRQNILRATATHTGSARGTLRSAAIRPRRIQRIPTDPYPGQLQAPVANQPQGTSRRAPTSHQAWQKISAFPAKPPTSSGTGST